MRWPWQRAALTVGCPRPCRLPSAEADVPFEATFTATWRPALRSRDNLAEQVRCDLRAAAAEITAESRPDDLLGAEDHLNAMLGLPTGRRTEHYRLLSVRFALRLTPTSQQVLAVRRADAERVRRLQFLKTSLYDHPGLVVIDHMERYPKLPDAALAADLSRLSRAIRSADEWWYPLLEQWETLGAGFRDPSTQHAAMQVLLQHSVQALETALTPPKRVGPGGGSG